jgi:hypothetical protein
LDSLLQKELAYIDENFDIEAKNSSDKEQDKIEETLSEDLETPNPFEVMSQLTMNQENIVTSTQIKRKTISPLITEKSPKTQTIDENKKLKISNSINNLAKLKELLDEEDKKTLENNDPHLTSLDMSQTQSTQTQKPRRPKPKHTTIIINIDDLNEEDLNLDL